MLDSKAALAVNFGPLAQEVPTIQFLGINSSLFSLLATFKQPKNQQKTVAAWM